MYEEKLECVWDAGGSCNGKVEKCTLFEKELNSIISCEAHLDVHRKIMFLYKNKFEIEKIVDMKLEHIVKQCNMLMLSGINKEETIL